jgi:hypothetical protein
MLRSLQVDHGLCWGSANNVRLDSACSFQRF